MTTTRNALLAGEIRAELGRQEMSRRELARRVGKPETTVARYLRGATDMSIDTIEQFAKALDVTTVDLIARAYGSMPPFPPFPRNGGSDSSGPTNPCLLGERVIIGPWSTDMDFRHSRFTAA
jgi:transcriptional regulator with XRE-family HTH domain